MKRSYCTDRVMEQLFQTLSSDMKRCLNLRGNMSYSESALQSRSRSLLLHDGMSAYTYKWSAQLSSILKRYTFQNDIINPVEREELTNVKFIELQASLATNYWRRRTLRLHEVLRRARSHSRRILSGFAPKDLHEKGRFGTKATIGCPASDAYIDQKLLTRPITGSALHKEWFTDNYLVGDPLLTSIIKHREVQVIAELSQINVPKKYNIDRGINPNTLIGSLHSSALGKIIEEALRKEGLDIRRLQGIHSAMIERASTRWIETGYIPFATGDLSNASHSFLSHHLNALLPREWYRACMCGVIRSVEVGQSHIRLESIMTMGIGFTFPMQTLLFYCLLLSIQELSNIKGRISVYGDDLIYPVKMHQFVVAIFKEMGFQFNLDKTFVGSPFRESCGSDWFKGVDVRPFAPEGQYQLLGKTQYAAFCYKLINGLLRKWHESEVSSSILLLKFCISQAMGEIFYVPPHFPDYSGIKVPTPIADSVYEKDFLCGLWPLTPSYQGGPGSVYNSHYTSLVATNQRRYVVNHSPYYWDWLRARQMSDVPGTRSLPEIRGILRTIGKCGQVFTSEPPIEGTPTFEWIRKRHLRKHEKFIMNHGKKMYRRYAAVAEKSIGTVTRYEVSLVNVCSPHTEERELS